MKTEHKGISAAFVSYTLWGLLPIYWKVLDTVPAYEILLHRMVWSLVVTLGLLVVTGKISGFFTIIREKRQLVYFLLTAMILTANWLIYIWAVNSGFIIEASLGYFINPLVTVCFGVIFLKEKIRSTQKISVCIAAVGVAYLTWLYGSVPWVALCLASSFACYGLLRKITPVPPLEGLCLETAILFLPALGGLIFFEITGSGSFLHGEGEKSFLLVGTGVATTVPLLSFCYAAQKIPLFLIGLLQYLSPSISLVVGIFLYHEEFPMARMAGFLIIWTALVLFVGEGLLRQLHMRRMKKSENI